MSVSFVFVPPIYQLCSQHNLIKGAKKGKENSR